MLISLCRAIVVMVLLTKSVKLTPARLHFRNTTIIVVRAALAKKRIKVYEVVYRKQVRTSQWEALTLAR